MDRAVGAAQMGPWVTEPWQWEAPALLVESSNI